MFHPLVAVLIRLPEGTQASGSIGGTTYSHNRYGAYKRNRTVPVNPNTDRQIVIRNAIRALTIRWQLTLTQAQRDAWDVYAANVDWVGSLGDTINLTGIAHYVRSNVVRIQAVAPVVDDAPTIFNLATAELALSATASEATQQASISFDDTADWASEDGAFQFLFGGLPQNTAIKFFGAPFRQLTPGIAGNSTTPPTSPVLVSWPWPFAEDNRLWLRTRIGRADGRLSEFAQVNFLADA